MTLIMNEFKPTENSTDQYTVGHNTPTFIFDENLTPRVIWTGYSWNPDDFTSDVEKLLNEDDSKETSAINVTMLITIMIFAAIFMRVKDRRVSFIGADGEI